MEDVNKSEQTTEATKTETSNTDLTKGETGGVSTTEEAGPKVGEAKVDENGNPILDEQGNNVVYTEAELNGETSTEDNDEDTTKEVTFDTSRIDQIGTLLTEAGLTPEDVTKEIAKEKGQITPEIYKALVDKHGEAAAGLVKEQLEGVYKNYVEVGKANDAAVYSQVQEAFQGITEQSGEQTFAELKQWASKNIDKETRAELNTMLQKGGMQATFAINHLVEKFKGSDDFTQPAQLLEGDGFSDTSNVKPLTKKEYQTEFRKLEAAGEVYGESEKLRQLDRRRQQGINRGL